MANYSACLQTASINLGCASNVGGIRKAYLVAGTISGITYNASANKRPPVSSVYVDKPARLNPIS